MGICSKKAKCEIDSHNYQLHLKKIQPIKNNTEWLIKLPSQVKEVDFFCQILEQEEAYLYSWDLNKTAVCLRNSSLLLHGRMLLHQALSLSIVPFVLLSTKTFSIALCLCWRQCIAGSLWTVEVSPDIRSTVDPKKTCASSAHWALEHRFSQCGLPPPRRWWLISKSRTKPEGLWEMRGRCLLPSDLQMSQYHRPLLFCFWINWPSKS